MNKLEAQHIRVEAGGKAVVRDVSFSLERGSVSVLMGPNGSGKSTLVNALMGHPRYKLTEGSLTLNGKDVTVLLPHEKAVAGLFLSLQHVPRVGGSTLATFLHKVHVARTGENTDILEYYLTLRELAKKLGITDTLLDRPLTDGLSGGEKKLSEVLQLAVLKPGYAILDEIDSGVDVDALRIVFRAVASLAKEGTAFLIISHHPSLLEYIVPDQVHVMAGGRLVRSGDKELAKHVLKHGFCKLIDCPLEQECKTRG